MNARILSASLLLLTSFGGLAAEVPYIPGTGWKIFTFQDPMSAGGDARNTDGEFSFTVYPGQNAVLTVADGGWNNEVFEVFNNGSYAGWITSAPGPAGGVGQHWTDSFDTSGNSSNWSTGSWALSPGSYKLAFRLQQWNSVKSDVQGSYTYRGAFKVAITDSPDADGDKIADQFETGTGIYVSPVDTGTDPAESDTDGDGLGDWIEIFVHGTDPNNPDTDGDGFRDLAEIQAGKSPTDPASNPDAVLEARTAVEVTIYTKAGTNYQVEWSENLEDWTTLPEVIAGDGNPVTRFYSTREHPRRFFRAAKLLAE